MDWPIVTLEEIFEISRGGSPRPIQDYLTDNEDGINWIMISDATNSTKYINFVKNKIRKEGATKSRMVYPGDLLLTNSMSFGHPYIMNTTGCIHDGWLVLSKKVDVICIDYFYHILGSDIVYSQFDKIAAGATVKNLNVNLVKSVKVPLPPLSEQKRIVAILQEAEEIRRLRVEAERKTAELIPGIFRGFFGDIGSNSKGWPVVPIASIVDSFQGGKSLNGIESDFDASKPRVLKISAVTSGFLVPSESKALPSEYVPPVDHFIRLGDLLITRANTEELVGATALILEECPDNLVLPDKIWRFVWKNDYQGTPEFVWALFQEKATRKALGNIATGTGGSMKNISMKKLMQMRIVWPPEELQQKFSIVLRGLLQLCNEKIGGETERKLLSSLSAHAFSGRLTATWRESNSEMLAHEAQKRDAILNKGKPAPIGTTIHESSHITEQIDAVITPGHLNREQQTLLTHLRTRDSDSPAPTHFTAESIGASLEGSLHGQTKRIESHLEVLAIMGFIIPLSRPRLEDNIGPPFAACYRLTITDKQDQAHSDDARSETMATLFSLIKESGYPLKSNN